MQEGDPEARPMKADGILSSVRHVLVAGAALGSLSIWLIGIIVCYDVVMRYLGAPTLWALEISTYLMIGAAVFASGLAIVRNDHFAVEIFPDSLPRYPRRMVNIVINVTCAGLLVFVSYGFWELLALSYRFEINSATLLHVPMKYPQAATFIGFALMVLGFVYKAFSK